MLELKALNFHYPQSADLQMDFSFSAKAGEITSIIGGSGEGKTTLLQLIAGFLKPQSGELLLNQHSLLSLKPAQRPVSLVFQDQNLFPHLDLFTNIALGINPSLKLTTEQTQSIQNVIASMQLDGLEKRKPGELSGGQQQRATLARVVLRKRPVLLLDEPFAALGPAQRNEMIVLLKQLVTEQQLIALMVSHNPEDAIAASTQSIFIHQGKVLCQDSTQAVLFERQEPAIRSYLGQFGR